MTPVEMSLQVMWKGMLGILIVIAIIIVSTYILHFVVNKLEKMKADKLKAIEEAKNNGEQNVQ